MARNDDDTTAATVALDSFSDPRLWTPEEQQQPAMYLHHLIARRTYSGLGADIIDWACRRAGELGNDWVRIDVWTDNTGLHRYYERQGFQHVRTLDLTDYPSGALFQRNATDQHGARTSHRSRSRPANPSLVIGVAVMRPVIAMFRAPASRAHNLRR